MLKVTRSYLMHWPVPMNPHGNHPLFPKLPDGSRDLDKSWSHIQTWKAMEKLLNTGKVKAIGVCNYSLKYLEELLPQVDVVPAANQIENHPSLPQQEIVDFCKSKGIHLTAYSPLGSTGGPLFKEEAVLSIAEKRGVPPANVLLSYHSTLFAVLGIVLLTRNTVARGSSVLAKSVTPSRIEENKKIVQLDASDMQALESVSKKGLVRYVYPAFGVDFGFPDKS